MKTKKALRHIITAICIVPVLVVAAPQDQPLLQSSNITHLGSFQIPSGDNIGCNGNTGAHCFTYGGLFGFNSERNSLFMSGHSWAGGVGEVTIPALNGRAAVLQNIYDVSDGISVDPGEVNGQGPSAAFVYNHRLIISGSTFYDADYSQALTHGISGFDFSVTNDFQQWYRVGPSAAANARSIGGYMCHIPQEWQTLLGGPALTGNCCLSIITASSAGPSATVFDPDDIGAVNPIPATTLVYYPSGHDLDSGDPSTLFNLATGVNGVAFPAGSRSVLFFGRQGTGRFCYGDGGPCGDPCDGSKGCHAYPYRYQVWAYDANDLLAVKNGSKETWEPRPYAVWELEGITTGNCARMAGAAYDPATGKLYVCPSPGDNPIVHVFQITVPGTAIGENCTDNIMNGAISANPNPFNPAINISIQMERSQSVQLLIYTANGKRITDLTPKMTSGRVIWDASIMPSGVYIAAATIGNKTVYKRITLMK